jgi:hypothetical protein
MRQPVGIVHVLVPRQAPEYRLTELANQDMAAVLARPGIRKDCSGQLRQAEGIIEIPKREQPSVGRDLGAVEFELQAGIERDPKSGLVFFTHCTAHL